MEGPAVWCVWELLNKRVEKGEVCHGFGWKKITFWECVCFLEIILRDLKRVKVIQVEGEERKYTCSVFRGCITYAVVMGSRIEWKELLGYLKCPFKLCSFEQGDTEKLIPICICASVMIFVSVTLSWVPRAIRRDDGRMTWCSNSNSTTVVCMQ